ncbi:hypothetical protein [Streptomyces syringium]|uniref:hypothetical protein n=1 Tax=Streptomyces syringium TaxID=76729 RepID=UPI0033EE1D32
MAGTDPLATINAHPLVTHGVIEIKPLIFWGERSEDDSFTATVGEGVRLQSRVSGPNSVVCLEYYASDQEEKVSEVWDYRQEISNVEIIDAVDVLDLHGTAYCTLSIPRGHYAMRIQCRRAARNFEEESGGEAIPEWNEGRKEYWLIQFWPQAHATESISS